MKILFQLLLTVAMAMGLQGCGSVAAGLGGLAGGMVGGEIKIATNPHLRVTSSDNAHH